MSRDIASCIPPYFGRNDNGQGGDGRVPFHVDSMRSLKLSSGEGSIIDYVTESLQFWKDWGIPL